MPGGQATRLLVVGATGPLGRAVVGSALRQGHDVRALVRNPATAGLPSEVEVVVGDALDPSSLRPAVRDRQAVVCALGTPSPRTPSTLLAVGTSHLVRAMEDETVRRLVCVTLLGLGSSRANAALAYRQVILRVLAPMIPDKQHQEEAVRASDLDWVLVRPPTIVGGRGRGASRVILDGERGRVGRVVRDELAERLVQLAVTVEHRRQAIVVGRCTR